MKFHLHKKRLCWSGCILLGACPCLPPTTVLIHVVVLRLSPLPQFVRNVMVKLGREGRNTSPRKPIRAPLPYISSWSIKETFFINPPSRMFFLNLHGFCVFQRSLVANVQRRQLPDVGILFLNLTVRRSHIVSDSLNEVYVCVYDGQFWLTLHINMLYAS